MDFEPLLDLIRESDTIAIQTHENADADAVGSSLALKMILEDLGKGSLVVAPESVSKIGRILAESQGHTIQTSPPARPFDLVIFVDDRPTPSGPAVPAGRLAVIDHHEGSLVVPADFCFVDPSFASTSEMVHEFLEYLISEGMTGTIRRDVAIQLLSGIIADTGGLRLSVSRTLQRVVRISTLSGVELREVFSLMRSPQDPSLRIACLKGASRMKIRRTEGHLIVTTQVSSFQGDVASNILHLGADVAFAGGKKKQVISISARARSDVTERGLSLARIMHQVASKTGGQGGGHPGAAALKGHGDVDDLLEMCVTETKRAIRGIKEASKGRGAGSHATQEGKFN